MGNVKAGIQILDVVEIVENKDLKNSLDVKIKGVVTRIISVNGGVMTILDVNVDVTREDEPMRLKARVHGPQATTCLKNLRPGSIVEFSGTAWLHRPAKGNRQPVVNVSTRSVDFCKRGEKHYAKVNTLGYLVSEVQDVETVVYDKTLAAFATGVNREVKGKVVKEYLDVAAFAGLGDIALKYLHPGMQLRVEGNLTLKRWRQEGGKGQKMARFNVAASKVTFGKQLAAPEVIEKVAA